MKISTILAVTLLMLTGCAELHQHQGRFAATGASANILFFQIPRDPLLTVQEVVPAGANVANVSSTPNDWKTVLGFFNRLFGIGLVQIGGTTGKQLEK